MTAALDANGPANTNDGAPAADPQAHGWIPPTAFDYARYNGEAPAVNAEASAAFDEATARRNDGDHQWASNAEVYEWKDEYGDVGPTVPELELILFGKKTQNTGQTGGALNWDG